MIEFIEDCHIYLNDGVIIPSVSELVSFATKKDFTNIPCEVLKKAQEYGTALHDAIYKLITSGEVEKFDDIRLKYGLEEFLRLKDEYIKDPICERIVSYKGRYAGRYDCLSCGILIDYKTNYKPDIESLEWQMGFYKMAIEETGQSVFKCMCLWLPKGKVGDWIEIKPREKKECLKVLEDYEQANQSPIDPYESQESCLG